MEVLIFYADKLIIMGNSKNLSVFIFAILFKLRKLDAREIYMFCSSYFATMMAGYSILAFSPVAVMHYFKFK